MEKFIGRTKEGRKIDVGGENFEVGQRRVERITQGGRKVLGRTKSEGALKLNK